MAINARERLLIGVALMAAAGGGLGYGLVLPAWSSVQEQQATLETTKQQVGQLQTQLTALQADAARYRRGVDMPEGVTIRTFSDTQLEAQLKSMLGELLRLATQTGNQVISLEPQALPAQPPTPPPTATTPTAANPPAGSPPPAAAPPSGEADPNASAQGAPTEPDPNTLLKVYPYKLVFRGSYGNVLDLLSSLNQQKELVEIEKVAMTNEAGVQRSTAQAVEPGSNLNPTKPIQLELNVKLVLQPRTIAVTPTPSSAAAPTSPAPL